MDIILKNLQIYYSNNSNNNYNIIKDFIKENNNQILIDFFNKLILLLINIDYNLIVKDKEEISNIIKDIASKNIIFNVNSIFDEQTQDFFEEVKTYNVRGLLLDIITENYNIDKNDFEIFDKIPAKDLFNSIVSNQFLIRDDIRLIYFKYNSKFLKNTFPHVEDENLTTNNTPSSLINSAHSFIKSKQKSSVNSVNFAQSIFNRFINYYSMNNNYDYINIKNVLKHKLSLFKNCDVQFTSNELSTLINNQSQIDILNTYNRNPIIKKSILIKLSIIKAYIIDILIEDNILLEYDLFKKLFKAYIYIKSHLYGDVNGQIKYFSSFLRKNYPNENDENLRLKNWNDVYSNIDKHIKVSFFENEDNYIRAIINNLTFWHTEHYLSIFKNAPEALKSYSEYFINNSDINEILKKFDNNLTIINNKSKFIINDSQYLVMKKYEDTSEYKKYIDEYTNLLNTSSNISFKKREMCINWMVHIHKKYIKMIYEVPVHVNSIGKKVFKKIEDEKSMNSLYLAILYLDKYFFYKRNVDISDFKIIALTCLFLASIYEDDYPLEKRSLIRELNLGANYEKEKIFSKKMSSLELVILNIFDYAIYIPTILYFTNIYMENINIYISEENIKLLYYMLELTLQYSQFIRFKFSIIAISAMYLIIKNNKNTVDSLFTISDTTFDDKQIKNCIFFIKQIVKFDIKSNENQEIRQKYKNEYEILKNKDF
jgi:hypothetical protein